jgi:hypothetical protein
VSKSIPPTKDGHDIKPMEIVRVERSPAGYSPFGRADGEGSQPRRKSRSAETVNDDAHNLDDAARLKRSPGYSPFGGADGEGSQPRRRARSFEDIAESSQIDLTQSFRSANKKNDSEHKPMEIVRVERSPTPGYSPFGGADGEGSQPRRRARYSED